MQEFDLIRKLSERLKAGREDTRLGMGDDAAIVAPPPGREIVVTTDTLVAGRHFPENATATDIGYKSLAVSLSDVAAMGAEPAWATIALTAPQLEASWCDAFVDGALQAIGDAAVDIIGGDTTRGPLSITGTVFGLVQAGQAVLRSGARPGDVVCVTGTLGDAALGLEHWMQEHEAAEDEHEQWLYHRLNRPQWRDGTALPGRAHAAIDVSDGLLADLEHITSASGCGACVDASKLPSSAAFDALCPADARRSYQMAGGDDYELCIVLPDAAYASLAQQMDCPLSRIGTIEAQPGIRLTDTEGSALTVADYSGWDHFR